MITKTLYRYKTEKYTVDSLTKPDCEYIERARLIADEGKMLTKDGEKLASVVDVDKDDASNWYEVEQPTSYRLRRRI